MDELLKEAGEEAEMVLENGLTSSLAKKKDGQCQFDTSVNMHSKDDEADVISNILGPHPVLEQQSDLL